MSFFTPDNFQQITGGRWLGRRSDRTTPMNLSGVGIDSRSIERGQVFCAVRGERFDGHDYLSQAVAAGSPLLIVERAPSDGELEAGAADVLLVDNTVTALARLAKAYRRTLAAKVIAVTGSVGKTTTKNLIHAVLRSQYTGRVSPRSFNNQFGVPLTILSAQSSDAYLVVEIGTNAPGEIGALAAIAQPDIAVITHVGAAHLEGLGDVGAVLREKASLLSHLRDEGAAIINADVPGLSDYRKVAPNMITYGRSGACDLRLTDCRLEADGVAFQINDRQDYRLPLLGRHNALNALAAVAVGKCMKLSEQQIAAGLQQAEAPSMRLELQRIEGENGTVTLINDAYNANPESMAAALAVLSEYPAKGRRIAVLGDMAELGSHAPDAHRALGQRLLESKVDQVAFVGPLSLFAAETINRNWPQGRVHVESQFTDTTPAAIAALLESGDTVLIKGSRAIQMERLIPAIEQRFCPEIPARRDPCQSAVTTH